MRGHEPGRNPAVRRSYSPSDVLVGQRSIQNNSGQPIGLPAALWQANSR